MGKLTVAKMMIYAIALGGHLTEEKDKTAYSELLTKIDKAIKKPLMPKKVKSKPIVSGNLPPNTGSK